MKVLFVHQNFPGQFSGFVERLADDPDYSLAGIGTRAFTHPRVLYRAYNSPAASEQPDLLQREAASRIDRAQSVAAQARLLRLNGFTPDVIIAHSGWSEALFLRDIYPEARIICYCEYYYQREHGDIGFDPEFPLQSLDILHRLRIRNAFELASIDDADLCICPTEWQRSTYPQALQSRMHVIHEGVDHNVLAEIGPAVGNAYARKLGIAPGVPVVTYVARYLEPQRGFHVFMRALPRFQELSPEAHVVIVGSEQGGYGQVPESGKTWKDALLQEHEGRIDLTRVHFTGRLTYREYAAILRRSDIHVYLTYPFVLSWSALESMAMGKAIVASGTAPVTEFMEHDKNARLVDFFQPDALAETMAELMREPEVRRRLGRAARRTIARHDLSRDVAFEKLKALLKTTAG